MPVVNNYTELPDWSEVKFYEIISLNTNSIFDIQKNSNNEVLFAVSGTCIIVSNFENKYLKAGDYHEFNKGINNYSIKTGDEYCSIVRIAGNWSGECGTKGVFVIENSTMPKNIGDAADYDKTRKTDFDNHFHDCDEFWIIVKGSAQIATEGKIFEIESGNCVATKAGKHHDFIDIYETVHGVYFETSLKGLKREGHLWNHTHSKGAIS